MQSMCFTYIYSVLTTELWQRGNYFPPFTEEETEADTVNDFTKVKQQS